MRFETVVGVCIALLLIGAPAGAQDATISGTVVDVSKAVLPGVTVTATHSATGRQIVAVTGDRGEFRMPGVSPGKYRVEAELAGFATYVINELELLVGQTASLSIPLTVAGLTETVTVSSEVPLVDLSSAQIAGNIDPRQMNALPLQGRNWLDLSLMVKGVTGNDMGASRAGGVAKESMFVLNLDGQQISANITGYSNLFGQPGLSKDAIAEYQIVTNLFDITQGRSTGLVVNAISKSGTNTLSGSAYGYFRDDRLNSADFVAGRVLPYSNQQIGGTFGGPIVRDRLHYFASYEHERNPSTWIVQPPQYTERQFYPTNTKTNNSLVRGDYQMSNANRLSVRSSYFRRHNPFDEVSQFRLANYAADRVSNSHSTNASWSRVISPTLLQEVRVGYFHYHWRYDNAVQPEGPLYNFPGGVSVGAHANYTEEFWENIPSVRTDFTWNRNTHDLKFGAEILFTKDRSCWPNNVRGTYTFGTLPSDFARRFPLDSYNDPSRWDFSGLDSSVLRFAQNVAEWGENYDDFALCGDYSFELFRPQYSVWLGDTWAVNDRLTINLGVRYDLPWADLTTPAIQATDLVIDNGFERVDIGYKPIQRYLKQVAPRVGFAYRVGPSGSNRALVIRGGSGLFHGNNSSVFNLFSSLFNNQRVISNLYNNDGMPGFIQDPTRGVTPAQVLAREVPTPPQSINIISPTNYRLPFTWQSTVGFQKQLSDVIGFDADFIYYTARNQDYQRDPNVFYDPSTGYYRDPIRFGRPNPAYGSIVLYESDGYGDYAAITTALNRRYRNRFQAMATYTYMLQKNDTGNASSGWGGSLNNPFSVDENYGRSPDFQRHTVRANTVWDGPWGVNASASFMYGSGNYFQSVSSVDILRNANQSPRLTPDSSSPTGFRVIPRNDFAGRAIHKLDLRLAKDISFGGRAKLQVMAEVFNVYNHANYGNYNLVVGTAAYGRPAANSATTYLPRVGQLGVRVAF